LLRWPGKCNGRATALAAALSPERSFKGAAGLRSRNHPPLTVAAAIGGGQGLAVPAGWYSVDSVWS
jgi:hypothetical protein